MNHNIIAIYFFQAKRKDATEIAITYTSSGPAVATVSSTGEVKGIGKGDVIIVSNGDLTIAVAVIVNKSIEYDDTENVTEQETVSEKAYAEEVLVSEISVIDVEMLYH